MSVDISKVKRQVFLQWRNAAQWVCLETLSEEGESLNIDRDPNDNHRDHEFILPNEDMNSTGFDRSQDRSGGEAVDRLTFFSH